MESPLISVIVPVYNTDKYLNKCINSIVNQTYRNLEIILVDDGSTDQSREICDAWAAQDERIQVIHKENGGVSDARNAGLDMATGQYIGFVDSDDYIHPMMYEKLCNEIRRYKADLSMCGYCRIGETDGTIVEHKKILINGLVTIDDAIKYICYYGSFMVLWNKLYNRLVFNGLRFPSIRFGEDVYILPEIYNRCSRIVSLSQDYYYNVLSQNSLTRKKRTVAHLDCIEAYYNLLSYFEKKGLTNLSEETSSKIVDLYMLNMNSIARIIPEERKRVRQIKKMVRYAYIKHGCNIKAIHKLYVESAALYRLLLWANRKLNNRHEIESIS